MQVKRVFNLIFIALFSLLVILPARFYQSYSFAPFAIESNIMVNYLNVVDLVALVIMALCLIRSGSYKSKINLLMYFVAIFLVAFVELLFLIATDNAVYIGEILSKAIILMCAFAFGKYVASNYNSKELYLLYIIPLLILVVSSFFLRDYGGYASSNRVGTLGFGSNETAMFACVILCYSLFKRDSNMLVRALLFAASIASIMVVSSRRGLVIAIIIIALFVISFLLRRRRERPTFKLVVSLTGVVAIFGVFVFVFHDKIVDFFNNSPLYVRLVVSRRGGDAAFEMGDRFSIFDETLMKIINNPFGTFGSDELLAQNSFSHAHNVLLQSIATHGIIIGITISIVLILVFLKSLKTSFINLSNSNYSLISPLVFFIVYFAFDMLGYLLWNPKGLFWVVLTISIILFKTKKNPSSLLVNDNLVRVC